MAQLDLESIKRVGRRDATNHVRAMFEEWKPARVTALRNLKARAEVIQAMKGLTLRDVATYASEQFAQYSREAAQLPYGTPEQQKARERSEYWSIMDELLGPAADPDK